MDLARVQVAITIGSLMPWRCPACSTQIRHNEADATPKPGVVYRCYICRLELVFNPATNRLTVAPMHADEHAAPKRSR